MIDMSDEPGGLEDLVRRLIRDELEHGGLEKLLKAKQLMEASGVVVKPEGAVLELIGGTANVTVEPEIWKPGSMGATMAPAVMRAEGTVSPQVVEALRSTYPALAAEIQKRPERATAILNLFAAMLGVLLYLLQLHAVQHPASPVTPEHITQLFDQSQHITVNQTTIINPPPPPPPAPGAGQ